MLTANGGVAFLQRKQRPLCRAEREHPVMVNTSILGLRPVVRASTRAHKVTQKLGCEPSALAGHHIAARSKPQRRRLCTGGSVLIQLESRKKKKVLRPAKCVKIKLKLLTNRSMKREKLLKMRKLWPKKKKKGSH